MFVKYRLSNDKNDMFIQSNLYIEGNKFKRARTLDDSFGKFLQGCAYKGQAFTFGKRKQLEQYCSVHNMCTNLFSYE